MAAEMQMRRAAGRRRGGWGGRKEEEERGRGEGREGEKWIHYIRVDDWDKREAVGVEDGPEGWAEDWAPSTGRRRQPWPGHRQGLPPKRHRADPAPVPALLPPPRHPAAPSPDPSPSRSPGPAEPKSGKILTSRPPRVGTRESPRPHIWRIRGRTAVHTRAHAGRQLKAKSDDGGTEKRLDGGDGDGERAWALGRGQLQSLVTKV